jgi:hypothetical protein
MRHNLHVHVRETKTTAPKQTICLRGKSYAAAFKVDDANVTFALPLLAHSLETDDLAGKEMERDHHVLFAVFDRQTGQELPRAI